MECFFSLVFLCFLGGSVIVGLNVDHIRPEHSIKAGIGACMPGRSWPFFYAMLYLLL